MAVMKLLAVTITLTVAACAYDARFNDCAISCSAATGCPSGLSCGSEGLCRTPGLVAACSTLPDAAPPSDPPSCSGLAATCGLNANDDCCSTAMPIPGGTFYRGYDVAADSMYPDMSYPATVSAFRLDKYEVTVGRFRAFVDAGMGIQASAPAMDAGARTLNGMASQGGWNASWNVSLSADTITLKANVKCDSTYQTWTDTVSIDDNRPMNCVTWYEAMAFCIWDGGFLPTEVEWNFAAAGGDEQRAYPWSSPASSTTIDCSYANYDINIPSGTYCINGTTGATNRVGSESPKGDGKWGQSDLAGNVYEWTLDKYVSPYDNPCNDCADLTPAPYRVIRGGYTLTGAPYLRTADRRVETPTITAALVGVRCARM